MQETHDAWTFFSITAGLDEHSMHKAMVTGSSIWVHVSQALEPAEVVRQVRQAWVCSTLGCESARDGKGAGSKGVDTSERRPRGKGVHLAVGY